MVYALLSDLHTLNENIKYFRPVEQLSLIKWMLMRCSFYPVPGQERLCQGQGNKKRGLCAGKITLLVHTNIFVEFSVAVLCMASCYRPVAYILENSIHTF